MPPRCIKKSHEIIIQHQPDQNKKRRQTCEQIKDYLNAPKKKGKKTSKQ